MRWPLRARRWLPWLLLALGVVATAAVYWPGLTGGWVFDDFPNIVDNAAIHITPGHSSLGAWVNAALSSPASFLHRPLASITFALNWYFGGGNPWPFKLVNVLIHLANGVLLYCMLRALLRLLAKFGPIARMARSHEEPQTRTPLAGAGPERSEGFFLSSESKPLLVSGDRSFQCIDDTAATRLALVVSVAWMLLPINLLAVLYVVQRMESLCQVFVLAGLWAYLHGRWMMLTATDAGRDRRGLSLAATGIVLGTLAGLTSKETAVLLPVFCFLAEAIVLRFRRNGELNAQPEPSPGAARHPLPKGEGKDAEPLARWERRGKATRAQRGDEGTHLHDAMTGGEPNAPGEGTHTRRATPTTDTRLWTLFTITLFIPAVLGFLWLLRSALRPASWASRDFTLGQRLLTEPRVLVDYLHWTLFPNPEVLSLYHDEIVKSTGAFAPPATFGAMLLLAVLIVIGVLLRNRRPLVALGISWFFAAQLLTATIIPLELVFEQRMYFASIGVLLAVGALLLGLRWRIRLPLLRGVIVAIALLWFALATNLRAQEWSNPIRLAVAEANRHPTSPRAVYEAGRVLLIASNYHEGAILTQASKFLRQAAAIPGASALPDQALIMVVDHERQGDDHAYWDSMITKLRDQPTRQEDISALISLTNCYGSGNCVFDPGDLQRAYAAALSRPHPIARLDGAYAAFQRDLMHNDAQATHYLALAVKGDPSEPAYRVDLAALYARQGETAKALEQIDALRRMNYAGRLDRQIAVLEQLAEQGRGQQPAAAPPRHQK